jgi:hypothetical protein
LNWKEWYGELVDQKVCFKLQATRRMILTSVTHEAPSCAKPMLLCCE